MDNGYKTPDGDSTVYVSKEISNTYKKTTRIIDYALLDKALPEVKAKLKSLDSILALPDEKEYIDVKNDVKEFKEMLLDSKLKPLKPMHK